jgi:type IV secretory pathway TrbD component
LQHCSIENQTVMKNRNTENYTQTTRNLPAIASQMALGALMWTGVCTVAVVKVAGKAIAVGLRLVWWALCEIDARIPAAEDQSWQDIEMRRRQRRAVDGGGRNDKNITITIKIEQ